ncbi:MAG TPA: hydroxymethylglutaryl-CoA lyase [Chryseosolibacter sp.]|nr:hydroxymethylglutaryl-CoA lyase [Chryseosolibacter sp.]
MDTVKIIECPRDAMQGIKYFIPTPRKIEYINKLLQIGFDTIDFGSFVSAKAIPQMADTAQVLAGLDLSAARSKLLAIVANTRGAEEASAHEAIGYLGFPLSISETFQKRNTNKSISEALNTLEEIKNICSRSGKKLVTYISMGFGNPYGDPYEADMVTGFVDILITLGSDVISLADTIGAAESAAIESLFVSVSRQFPEGEIGVHLHSTPSNAREKINAAYRGGCRRFDGALRGFGGCPMANDELVGNIATEMIVSLLDDLGTSPDLDRKAFNQAMTMADAVFARG